MEDEDIEDSSPHVNVQNAQSTRGLEMVRNSKGSNVTFVLDDQQDASDVFDIYSAADRFLLEGLKHDCLLHIVNNMLRNYTVEQIHVFAGPWQ